MMVLLALGRRFLGQAYLLLTLTALMWGGNAVAGRIAIGEVSPMVIITIRWVIVVVVLALTAHRRILLEWRALLPSWRRVFLLGTIGLTVFNALFYGAAHHTTAINLGLIQGLVPPLTMLGTRLVYGTPIRPLQSVGLIVALAGVVLVASRGDVWVIATLDFNIGDVWMVIASLIYAAYTIGLRKRPPVSGLTFFAAMAAAAFVSSLPLLALEVATDSAQWPTSIGWATLIYIALLPSLIAQLLYIRGVELLGPGRSSLFVNLVPVFAALLGVVILGEHFALYHAAALALVLGGIAIAERGRPEVAIS
jgi:drug/metabolite transporter (DMT)-like permease